MEINSPSSVLVVAPGCPAGLITKLLGARILRMNTGLKVLLPPENNQQFVPLAETNDLDGKTEIVPSPARKFFSTRHLKWLKSNLRSAENPMVLIAKSPYQDLTGALVSLVAMLLSGKTITLLRATQEIISDNHKSGFNLTDQNDQSLTDNWLTIKLNPEVLAKEFGKVAWYYYPNHLKNIINYTERELYYYFDAYDSNPVNFQALDSSMEAIQKDVEHSLIVSDIYLNNLPDAIQLIKDKKVLEIGPGINFGPILTLACHGARALAADRFLTPWDRDYHQKFYAHLREKLKDRWPAIDLTPLDTVLSREGYPSESISLHSCSLEELWEVPDQSVDIVISNAVFEHLYDLKSAFSHLARITKPGGIGLHTADFRDHRDFSRPLEYLLLSNKKFALEFKERHGECGNRYRAQEMQQLLELVGFEVLDVHPILFIEEDYLAEFLPRLRQARRSRYRDYPVEDLRLGSGSFLMVKNPAKNPTTVAGKTSWLSGFAGRLAWP